MYVSSISPLLGLNRGALLHSTPYPTPAQSGSSIIITALRLLTAPAKPGSTQTLLYYPGTARIITIIITITIALTIIIATVLTTTL